jgi:hypothetical protein
MGLFGKKKDGSHSCCCSESCISARKAFSFSMERLVTS